MCPDCRAEYEDPRDRRFHAQPIACPACGPQLRALDGRRSTDRHRRRRWRSASRRSKTGRSSRSRDWVVTIWRAWPTMMRPWPSCVGANTAIKSRWRSWSRDVEAARALCEVSPAEEAILTSPRRPIVLLRRRPDAPIAPLVAPGNPTLGVMLPYTPLHHLDLVAS